MNTHEELCALSHDIRNMLSSVQLAAEELSVSRNPRMAVLGQRIQEGIARTTNMCERVIRQKPAPVAETPEGISIGKLIADVIDIKEMRFGRTASITVITDTELRLDLDESMLFRVLLNLVLNASEAIERHGGKRIFIFVYPGSDDVIIDVMDDGPGFPQHVLDHQKTPLHQEGNLRGIGLRSVRLLTERLGGRVVLANAAPKGAWARLQFKNCLSRPGAGSAAGFAEKNISESTLFALKASALPTARQHSSPSCSALRPKKIRMEI